MNHSTSSIPHSNDFAQSPGTVRATGAVMRQCLLALVLASALGACGGDGGAYDPNANAQSKQDGVGVPHTVGGSIAGLGSSGLTLKNGSETLSPAAGASSFVFATAVDDGAPYTVSINSQPGGFSRCSVSSNGNGVIAAADVTTITVSCAQTDAVVSTVAGSATAGAANGVGSAAGFNFPYGIASDAAGNIYVADAFNHQIRKIAPNGSVTTLAGNGAEGNADGAAGAARFSYPFGLAVDAGGNVYVADWGNHSIRKVAPDGSVTTLAGNGSSGAVNGSGNAASFSGPFGVAVDSAGAVYVADTNNNLIRKISPTGSVSTLAGIGSQGADNGSAAVASFRTPQHLAVDSSGIVFVADTGNHQIRRVSATGEVTTLAGSGEAGNDNGAAAAARFNNPAGIAVDSSGVLFVADSENQLIRRLTVNGQVSTLAGSGSAALSDGTGLAASFNSPRSMVIEANGTLLVADGRNHSIRRIVSQ